MKVHSIVFFEPGQAHIDSFRNKAEKCILLGYISSQPIITIEKCKIDPFWKIIFEVSDDDVLFWIGMNEAFDICRNNRPLMVGTE